MSYPPFDILSVCKGGGYRYCRTSPPHPKANTKGLYPLHRVLVENKLGRLLADGEVVHHVDGDKTNDSPNNLEVMTGSAHASHHRPRVDSISLACPVCGSDFEVRPNLYRLRRKRSKSGKVMCSRRCAGMR